MTMKKMMTMTTHLKMITTTDLLHDYQDAA